MLVVVLLVVLIDVVPAQPPWGYGHGEAGLEPSEWAQGYPKCSGKQQSPILLQHDGDILTEPFLTNYTTTPHDVTVTNNGKTILVDLTSLNQVVPYNNAQYRLEQVHFHWGLTNLRGSEHVIGNQAFPLEAHFVHYDNTLTFQQAVASGRLLVFAVLFTISTQADHELTRILNATTSEFVVGDVSPVHGFELGNFFDSKERTGYYAYDGSLTTPTCVEGVKWIVSRSRGQVTASQLERFRSFRGSTGTLAPNYRPIQPQNGRPISLYRVSSPVDHGQISPAGPLIAGLVLMTVMVVGSVLFYFNSRRRKSAALRSRAGQYVTLQEDPDEFQSVI